MATGLEAGSCRRLHRPCHCPWAALRGRLLPAHAPQSRSGPRAAGAQQGCTRPGLRMGRLPCHAAARSGPKRAAACAPGFRAGIYSRSCFTCRKLRLSPHRPVRAFSWSGPEYTAAAVSPAHWSKPQRVAGGTQPRLFCLRLCIPCPLVKAAARCGPAAGVDARHGGVGGRVCERRRGQAGQAVALRRGAVPRRCRDARAAPRRRRTAYETPPAQGTRDAAGGRGRGVAAGACRRHMVS